MKNNKQIPWEDHLKALATSGLSRAAYCREHDLNYGQLFRWQRRLAKVLGTRRTPRAFVKAKAEAALPGSRVVSAPSGVRLTVGDDTTIELPASADPRWIAELARAIGGHT